MQAEVVVLGAAEEDVGVVLERALSQHREPQLGQGRFVHPATGGQIADADPDVVDDTRHRELSQQTEVARGSDPAPRPR